MSKTGLTHVGYDVVQGFAPKDIVTSNAGVELDVAGTLAIRSAFPVDYQIKINDVWSSVGTMQGTTVIRGDVSHIKFVDTTTVEVM